MTEYKWFREENIRTIPELLESSVQKNPGKTALSYFGRNITYSQLDELSDKIANFLNLKTSAGDRVALLMPNIPQFVIAYYGTLKAGRIVTPINFVSIASQLKKEDVNKIKVSDELTAQIKDSRPSVIFVADILYPVLKQISIDWPCTIVIANIADYLPGLLKTFYPLKARREKKRAKIPSGELRFLEITGRTDKFSSFSSDDCPECIAELQYTGGTDGVPKGAVLTHRNLVSNALQSREQIGDLAEDGKEVMLGALPFFHIYGLTACMNTTFLAMNGTLILVPSFKPGEVAKLIEKQKVTIFPGVNLMYRSIMDLPKTESSKLKNLKLCFYGAGPLDAKVGEWFQKELGIRVMGGYGLSETSPVLSVTLPEHTASPRARGALIGSAVPGTKIIIVDENKNELPEGSIGEIAVSGPQVAKGYWQKEDETAAAFHNGWFYTGDRGQLIDGLLYFVDRDKDMSKVNGENIYHSFIEKAIAQNPLVSEVRVIGIPDSHSGDAVIAAVVLKEGAFDSADTRHRIRNSGNPPKNYVPKGVVIVRSFEEYKTPIGKVLKRKLKEDILKLKNLFNATL